MKNELTDKDLNLIGAKWHLNLLGSKDKDVVFAFARASIDADRAQRQAGQGTNDPLVSLLGAIRSNREEFSGWANAQGWDVAQAHGDGVTRWLNPVTHDVYVSWLEARAAQPS